MEHVTILTQIPHEADSWIIETDAYNRFNSVLRKTMLDQVAACTLALMGFVAKCHAERPASVVFKTNPREKTNLKGSSGVHQGDGKGPVLLFLPLRPVRTRFRVKYESQELEAQCITRRHHYCCPRDTTRYGGSGSLPRARVDSEGRTPQPGEGSCLGHGGSRDRTERYIAFDRC